MAALSTSYDEFGLEIQTLREAMSELGHKSLTLFYPFDLYV